MALLKKRKREKLNRYEELLRSKKYNTQEIYTLKRIYEKVVKLSNIFLFNIFMFIISLALILVSQYYADFKILHEWRDIILYVGSTVSAILLIVSFVLTALLILSIVACRIYEVRKYVFVWIILSFIPIPFLSFFFLFIAKWKISHIYKYPRT